MWVASVVQSSKLVFRKKRDILEPKGVGRTLKPDPRSNETNINNIYTGSSCESFVSYSFNDKSFVWITNVERKRTTTVFFFTRRRSKRFWNGLYERGVFASFLFFYSFPCRCALAVSSNDEHEVTKIVLYTATTKKWIFFSFNPFIGSHEACRRWYLGCLSLRAKFRTKRRRDTELYFGSKRTFAQSTVVVQRKSGYRTLQEEKSNERIHDKNYIS